ncbi:MAG: methyltransferase family protein [Longimicrobiales bacterium]
MSRPRYGMVKSLTDQGDWLFRFRGQAPIPILLVIVGIGLALGPRPSGPFQTEPWEAIGLLLGFLGMAVRAAAIGYAAPGTSGGNTQQQIAESLNTTGLYSIVRHPLYLGNFIMWVGVGTYACSWPCAVIASLSFALLYERIIIAEERFLQGKFGERFVEWTAGTPLFVPDFSQWVAPTAPLSIKRILRREYSTLQSFLVSIIVVELAQNIRWGHGAMPDPAWAALPVAGLLACLALRTLKKQSGLLDLNDSSGANG